MKQAYKKINLLLALSLTVLSGRALAWHDKTHLAIAQAAGYENWYNAAGADITKTKATFKIKTNNGKDEKELKKEDANHWYNNDAEDTVTDQMVREQADRYDDPADAKGHLYGAIIQSLRNYITEMNDPSKYAEYHMAFCAHYIGDLGMPLHNMVYKSDGVFNNEKRHKKYDGTIEYSVLNNIGFIQKNMSEIKIDNESDLIREIVNIEHDSYRLARKLKEENNENNKREMTVDEAYTQIYKSASLLRAVLICVKIPECRVSFVRQKGKQ